MIAFWWAKYHSNVRRLNANAPMDSIKDLQMFVDESLYVSISISSAYYILMSLNILENEPFNIDSIELSSIGAETNSICTSVSTQTPSVKDATIQTTHSLESLTAESPSDLNLKFSSFSNRRIRNYINYSKLVNSEFTKTSSIESSFKDESTQCNFISILLKLN